MVHQRDNSVSVVKSLFLFFFIGVVFPAQSQVRAALENQTDSLLAVYKKSRNVMGLAVSITVDGEVVYQKGFGYSDYSNKQPVNPVTTLFRVGSISKPFTTSGLIRLIENKKVHPDSSIYKYITDYPNRRWPSTVRQLAGHQGGIRSYRNDEFYMNQPFHSVREALDIFAQDSLIYKPGEDYVYSSYGYNLLSYVIEQVAGKQLDDYLREVVFDPLDMKLTQPDDKSKDIPQRAVGYKRSNGRTVVAEEVDLSNKWAGGGYLSSAEEVSRFAVAHSRAGFVRQYLLSMLQTPRLTNQGEVTEYGMGWTNRLDDMGNTVIGHSGGSVGGSCQMVIFPDHGITVVVLTNQSFVNFGGIQFKLGQLYIDKAMP